MANNSTPFQHNQLNQNVHAMGNLNEHLKQHKSYNTEPVTKGTPKKELLTLALVKFN